MDIDYLHVSAFTRTPGKGNPAAVIELDAWPSDEALSRIARAIGLPVTACLVRGAEGLELRWLSRAGSFVQSMCGHGTLAASLAVALRDPSLTAFSFKTPGGPVPVRHDAEVFHLALPRWDSTAIDGWPELCAALGASPRELLDAGRDVVAVFDSEAEVRALSPDMRGLLALGRRGFIATAAGRQFDCVSRFFCPSFGLGVDEDPVTGSAHCSIAPLWSRRLGKTRIRAFQASPAGGELICDVAADKVTIGAPAALLARAQINVS